ncbi:hypothetical protein SEA_GIRR_78 [Mycobacterium phage Girr]|uniref:Uncharacterized protein n=1 Tax=Mycobacterium phage Girr TaxID=2301565 RepID=A0A385DNW0_9CAUD|nr:hypothetical protein I5H43_gp078 [Mycobacterium phage Girr]AXQ61026.1 hypothetical protein SEA_GIRR_78 [Mycobacterium phage Girr]AXQ65084.1 hypothetical protein SEA_RUBY_76 [Mycobacterium phage Ruby]QAY06114.1 hypothetical protein SEA_MISTERCUDDLES_79 [Mycobacterium phage MisterCuddles]
MSDPVTRAKAALESIGDGPWTIDSEDGEPISGTTWTVQTADGWLTAKTSQWLSSLPPRALSSLNWWPRLSGCANWWGEEA